MEQLTDEEREDLNRMVEASELVASAGPLGPLTPEEAEAHGWSREDVAEFNAYWSEEEALASHRENLARYTLLKKLAADPPWTKVGETLWADEFWYTDSRAWAAWHNVVARQIEERGAWFLVGWTTNAERLVIDVLHPHTLPEFLRTRNIRGVEFWRGQS